MEYEEFVSRDKILWSYIEEQFNKIKKPCGKRSFIVFYYKDNHPEHEMPETSIDEFMKYIQDLPLPRYQFILI